MTRPVIFEGDTLLINAKANHFGSQVLAEVLDENGAPIEGFTADDCVPMNADLVRCPIVWRERTGVGGLAGRPVKLRFHLVNARLYAYRVS